MIVGFNEEVSKQQLLLGYAESSAPVDAV